ncbi:hypothetical protein B0J15DRAFT_487017 [Fusarium solani]|uniref:Uncharacterized protein n=1 Tax=Fusarium solani TaxID=169388 RepID=A0A9P9KUG5_FUSSL|nr:uncharacterized protein B0J15DRAFT_487017 [Fusarium solani]KAH7268754.1 hypothetical protein B0J15DRAFT_487017 [Fusarium solani]
MFLSCAVVALFRGLRQACKTTRHQHRSGLMAQASSGQIPVPRLRRCPYGAKRRQDTNLSLASAVCVGVVSDPGVLVQRSEWLHAAIKVIMAFLWLQP